MRRAALAAVAALCVAAPAGADSYLQAGPKELPLEGASRLRLEFPVGRLTLEGDDGGTVRVLVRVECRERNYQDCKREANRIRIDHRRSGDRLVIEFEGIRKEFGSPRVNVQVEVLVPRELASSVEMGVGELRVSGMRGDLDLELGVGELSVKVDEDGYRDAEAECGVGDATIRTEKGDVRERGFIGHTAHWSEGDGKSIVHGHVGIGEATITLR